MKDAELRRRLIPGLHRVLGAFALWIAVFAPAELVAGDAPSDTSPPNIVVIVLDDLGYSSFGVYGATSIATPHVDALAAEGMRFARFYANSTLCSPTRASLLTGRYPTVLGINSVLSGRMGRASLRGIPDAFPTLPGVLRESGYTTGHFGKWHLGVLPRFQPGRRGFDHSVVPAHSRANAGDSYFDRKILVDGTTVEASIGHFTRVVTDRTIAFMEANRERPFFANVWYNAPHKPIMSPRAWKERHPATPAGAYAALVEYADAQIGRLLAAIDRLKLRDRTIVVVTSDNGATTIPELSLNGPYRGEKGKLYEGGIRVPMIARWPGRIAAGSVTDTLHATFDLFPTFADVVGVQTQVSELDGRSMLGVWLGDTTDPPATPPVSDERTLFFESKGSRELRFAVRRGRWKLVHHKTIELFDVEADPGEMFDRSGSEPKVAAELLSAYQQWRVPAARIAYTVEEVRGDAQVEGSAYRLHGGAITLADDQRFNPHDGDFSFTGSVIVDEIGAWQTVAEQPGSWRLAIRANGAPELLIRHPNRDRRARRRGKPREVTLATTIVGAGRIGTDGPHRLGFTIEGNPRGNSLVWLYLDGVLQVADVLGIRSLSLPGGPVHLGSATDPAESLRGTLRDVAFYVRALDADEMARPAAGSVGSR